MEVAMSMTFLGLSASIWRWRNLDRAALADRIAHRLLAYAAGQRAQRAAVVAAMAKTVRLEEVERG